MAEVTSQVQHNRRRNSEEGSGSQWRSKDALPSAGGAHPPASRVVAIVLAVDRGTAVLAAHRPAAFAAAIPALLARLVVVVRDAHVGGAEYEEPSGRR